MNPAVAVGASAFCLTFPDSLCQGKIFCRDVHASDIVIVSAARYAKEEAHLADAVFPPVSVDHFVLDACFHSFPVSERKSRIRSFSIFKRLFSLLASLTCLL